MRNRQVPVVASWLLKKFVRGEYSESLLGDLLEEYQSGRAPGWYWGETLVALLHSLRRDGRRLLFRHVTYFISVLTAQCILLAWIVGLSVQHIRHCPVLPTLSEETSHSMLCVSAAEVAIVLMTWLRPFGIAVRTNRKSRFLRLLVLAFAAIGLGGGALTWAAPAACTTGLLSCSHSSVADSCALRDDASAKGRSAAEPVQPALRPGLASNADGK